MHQLLDTPIEVREPEHPVPLPAVRDGVRFERVSFDFDRGGPVLEDVSFSVGPGETIAIVGPSGSGKSTIADLLVRLLDPKAGRITLDGHDLRTLKLADLRRHVVRVDQEPHIFHTSIAENIRYARPDASDAETHRRRPGRGTRRAGPSAPSRPGDAGR